MKRSLLLIVSVIISVFNLQAQGVTQLNNNSSLLFNLPISNTQQIFVSGTDNPWVTDGTPGGTLQLSAVIKFVDNIGAPINGKLIFAGTTAAADTELYITDGTPAGTKLVKDINPGAPSSNPQYLYTINNIIYFTADSAAVGNELWRTDGTPAGTTFVKDINPGLPGSSIVNYDVAFRQGFLYFTAETALEGRELWRTDGTTAGTTLVKDIVVGTGGSNYPGNYELFATSTYLLFMARTAASGVELWISNGTGPGTVLLMDINMGADSSNARFFTLFNGIVLFEATDATHGDELWRTDGTPGGTTLLKDINIGPDSSTKVEIFPGLSLDVFQGFHIFNNLLYFNAYNGTSVGQVWSTGGSPANTLLVKDFMLSASFPLPSVNLGNAINLTNKFIFPVSDQTSRSELWESDGVPGGAGTVLFKSFALTPPRIPVIFNPVGFANTSGILFQGNKFFFSAGEDAEGYELWISDGVDGTATHTHIVKDINPGAADSDPGFPFSYLYTTTTFFFPANNATYGLELWKSDGTLAGTDTVKNINPGANDANPFLDPFIVNGKILLVATDGDNASETDLYAVVGTFTALPIKLTDFTVTLKAKDALLEWSTAQELNTKNFTIRRSYDAQHFEDIGIVPAAGTSSNRHTYSFTDPGIVNGGKSIVYYRLTVSDKDGKSENSNVISLKIRGNSQWNVHLLSNPVQDNVNVILSGITGNVRLSVRDMNGKTIYTKSLQNTNGQISLPVILQKGVYVLEADTNNERNLIHFIK
jgi:ELWxxDGT repeat protein